MVSVVNATSQSVFISLRQVVTMFFAITRETRVNLAIKLTFLEAEDGRIFK